MHQLRNLIRLVIVSAAATLLFSSCSTTDPLKKDHDYGLDKDDADVTVLPWNRREPFESNPSGNFPGTR